MSTPQALEQDELKRMLPNQKYKKIYTHINTNESISTNTHTL